MKDVLVFSSGVKSEPSCGLREVEIPARMDLFEVEREKLLGEAAEIVVRRIREEIEQELLR